MMDVLKPILKLADLGRAPLPDQIQRRLFRATNLLTINAMFWLLFAVAYDFVNGNISTSLGPKVLPPVVLFQFLVLWLNVKGKTNLAITLLNLSCGTILTFFSIRDGADSMVHLHFISVIIGTTIMFARKESVVYFFINFGFTLACIILVLVSFQLKWNTVPFTKEELESTRNLHFFILLFVSLFFSVIVIITFSRQQNELKKALHEKEILLSEVFHRVKNNMAVILGLINLKKYQSENPETIDALHQCHMRVMSMAMVHNRIYHSKSLHRIELDAYLKELSQEILNSMGDQKQIEIFQDYDSVLCDIAVAIPLGLITNEILTNAYKHAFPDNKGKIEIRLKEQNKQIQFSIKDDGRGLPDKKSNSDSLGMTLIDALCEQVDAKYSFTNDHGLLFEMKFALSEK